MCRLPVLVGYEKPSSIIPTTFTNGQGNKRAKLGILGVRTEYHSQSSYFINGVYSASKILENTAFLEEGEDGCWAETHSKKKKKVCATSNISLDKI